MIRVFVQARMSSRRFPGKVLAPLAGEPIIRHVLRAVESALPAAPVIVVTSVESSDDPLAAYLTTLGVPVFRGPRDDVFERFRLCASRHPCEFVLRVCADSPRLDPGVLRAVVARGEGSDADVVTTTFPRTFPRGQNAELIRTDALLRIDPRALTAHDREHVTAFLYRHPGRFRIANVESRNPRLAALSVAVDTVEDLERVARMSPYDLEAMAHDLAGTAGASTA
jgi:spore coat polysaccharide biosynthesis protein SpsF